MKGRSMEKIDARPYRICVACESATKDRVCLKNKGSFEKSIAFHLNQPFGVHTP